MADRKATVERNTLETQVRLSLDLDGQGQSDLDVGVPFFEHMLDQIARHGMLDLNVRASGDTHIDDHHTVEDVGIALGQALREACGDKAGIRRFGHAYCPLDEALSRVVVDLSGRPGLTFNVDYPRDSVGGFDVELVQEFFQGLVNHAFITVHVDNLRGTNTHHVVETVFKAAGRALRAAVEQDPRLGDATPSTKGAL
ncbi:imidazoleglycerol-phosphate dehydratase HisB [Aquisalimonas asiatica]|uniref:Imidazoleglycerol-phosphate dehydratase n=1 Tax=Aquisalimonas asiatica TaxID=406100 RepID=A0A1H8TCP9_9GAMM|nr:imidazoleglycerol-phosphate dehydratase HisB [Aquisalimonas asiatica]SEO88278.1 imidazoleglycerol-phosphate dehydratase [Aquisalimonas asiatica]